MSAAPSASLRNILGRGLATADRPRRHPARDPFLHQRGEGPVPRGGGARAGPRRAARARVGDVEQRGEHRHPLATVLADGSRRAAHRRRRARRGGPRQPRGGPRRSGAGARSSDAAIARGRSTAGDAAAPGSGRLGTSGVEVSRCSNFNRSLSATTLPLGERSVKEYPRWPRSARSSRKPCERCSSSTHQAAEVAQALGATAMTLRVEGERGPDHGAVAAQVESVVGRLAPTTAAPWRRPTARR